MRQQQRAQMVSPKRAVVTVLSVLTLAITTTTVHAFVVPPVLKFAVQQRQQSTTLFLSSPNDNNNYNNNERSNTSILNKTDTASNNDFTTTTTTTTTTNDDNDNNEESSNNNNDEENIEITAKKEEPGDREAIIAAIRKYQASLPSDDEPRFPIGTILSRTWDTAEDAYLHARRIPYDLGWIDEDLGQEEDNRETIVVLGSGWAAHALLKVADTYKQRIIVVSPSNHFVFTPMLASAAVGTVEYRSMTEAVRASNPMIENYIEGTATDVNVEEQTVTVELKSMLEDMRTGSPPGLIKIEYDKLVVAVGCQVAQSFVKGAKEYAYGLKSCDDARKLRKAVGEAFEYASRPDVKDEKSLSEIEREQRRAERRRRLTFTIVGGGPTGVELAGELADYVKDVCKPRVGAYPDLLDDIQIVLIHGGPALVPQFDEELTKRAYESLSKTGVDIRLNTYVNEVGDGWIRIIPKGENQVEETVYCGVTVWAAGTEPVPFTKKLLDQLPEEARGIGGKILVDEWLRCPMKSPDKFGSVLVMGDAAAFPTGTTYLPQTAQVAGQQGAYVARLLDRQYDMTQTPPALNTEEKSMELWLKFRGLDKAKGFEFLNLGLLAYVGSGEALTQVQIGDVPIASYAGSTAFILWRSVYLVKQVATRNRVLVTFDWIKSAIFGRDITRL